MKRYEKWRDLNIDPQEIKFKKTNILNQISFPHCGNDVVECISELEDGSIINTFIKIERSTKASFQTEVDHLKKLSKYNFYQKIPKIIEDGYIKEKKYLVLTRIEGSRLSDLFLEINDQELKSHYLIKYGNELAKIHNISHNSFSTAKQRSINDYPSAEKIKKDDGTVSKYIDYLMKNKPEVNFNTFIHGDFHYANVLWENQDISGVLDWEYSGKGFKEQDIAWSCILRESQKFMDNIDDIKYFLQGYNTIGNYDQEKLKWCLINGYCHFYLMSDDKEYRKQINKLLIQINKK